MPGRRPLIDLVRQDRGASLRICPVFAAADPQDTARQFNVEFRVCDAAASPYLALGAVIFAGADGLRRSIAVCRRPQAKPPSLPRTLDQALEQSRRQRRRRRAGSAALHRDAYLRFKRVEAEKVAAPVARPSSAPTTPRFIEVNLRSLVRHPVVARESGGNPIDVGSTKFLAFRRRPDPFLRRSAFALIWRSCSMMENAELATAVGPGLRREGGKRDLL